MAEQLIELAQIQDNPYQPRTTDDPEHIEKLARSIAADGLLQIPRAQKIFNGCYELAYGHSRRKAFEWLKANWQEQVLPERYNGYSVMPLDVVDEISDEDLYRFAIAENIQRKDLNPIEIAQAMKRYMDEFKASSKRAGELFNMSDSTVRGMVRLLDLPEEIQTKVAAGEISQGAARKLVTSVRSGLDKEELMGIVEDIQDGEDPDDAIEATLRNKESVVTMWESWRRQEKALAGPSLWALSTAPDQFPSQHLPQLTATDFMKALDLEVDNQGKREIASWIGAFYVDPQFGGHWWKWHGNQKIDGNVSEFLIEHGAPADQVEKIEHLVNPPSCKDCPFHVVLDRSHYCTFKLCHQSKTKAWVAEEMERVSKKLGIAIYNPEIDGKAFLPLSESTYESNYQAHAKLVEKKDPCLRLQPHKDGYSGHKWTESHRIRVIMVGEKAQAAKEKKSDNRSREQQEQAARERQWQLDSLRSDASRKFAREYAISFLGPAFAELTNVAALCALAGEKMPRKDAKKKDVLANLHRELAFRAVDRLGGFNYMLLKQGPAAVAKFLQGVAATWGIKLPADFLDIAKGYEPVAVETPKKKAKK